MERNNTFGVKKVRDRKWPETGFGACMSFVLVPSAPTEPTTQVELPFLISIPITISAMNLNTLANALPSSQYGGPHASCEAAPSIPDTPRSPRGGSTSTVPPTIQVLAVSSCPSSPSCSYRRLPEPNPTTHFPNDPHNERPHIPSAPSYPPFCFPPLPTSIHSPPMYHFLRSSTAHKAGTYRG
jgi:hypothetical protein